MTKESAILVLNAGSSSLKYSLFSMEPGSRCHARGMVKSIHSPHEHEAALASVLEKFANWPLAAVGHRVVHGGLQFTKPVRVTAEVLDELETLVPLAPLHQPHNLAPIRRLMRQKPDVPQVACFDTAFHRTQNPISQTYALPRGVTALGIRRYGFHGLSYESVAKRLRTLGIGGRVIVAHLGNGASLCAMRDGVSVATTMGFTPADGLMMGTRCGSIDPGVLIYLMRAHNYDVDRLERLINSESGLLGVSGISSDMQTLLASDSPHAREAIAMFIDRISRELGAMAAALGGVDAIVFTGGIGENAASIRQQICQQAAWLGVKIDHACNEKHDTIISERDGKVLVGVIPTDEDAIIAAHTQDTIKQLQAKTTTDYEQSET